MLLYSYVPSIKFTIKIVLSTLIGSFLLCSNYAYASHAKSVDLSYVCLGDSDNDGLNEYEIRAALYRDCDGITEPNSLGINMSSYSCNQFIFENLELEFANTNGNSETILDYQFTQSDSSKIYIINQNELITIDIEIGDTIIESFFFNSYSSDPPYLIDTIFDNLGAIDEIIVTIIPNNGNNITVSSAQNAAVYLINYEVSPICEDEINSSSCNGGNLPGTEKFIYSKKFELPMQCEDWLIEINLGTRNQAISNLSNPDMQNLYAYATLNNLDGNCYSSPQFVSTSAPYYCVGQTCNFNPGVIELDGHTISYSLINSLDGFDQTINFDFGYSLAEPITTAPGNFNLDTLTGQTFFIPTQSEICVLTYLIETRDANQNVLATVTKDVQFSILNCTNQSATFNGLSNISASATQLSDYAFQACPNNLIAFDIEISDPDVLQSLSIETNADSFLPNATISLSGSNPVIAHFEWTPEVDNVGYNYIHFTAKDDNCPISNSETQIVTINVLLGAYAGEDRAYCTMGESIMINAFGGNSFSWTSDQINDGIIYNSLNGDTLIVEPLQTTTYYLESSLSSGCNNLDTIEVKHVPNFNYTFPQNETICLLEEIELTVDAEALHGPYTYNWSPNSYLNSDSLANPICQALSDVNYSCTITSLEGCQIEESVDIAINGILPFVEVGDSTDSSICLGVDIEFILNSCCEDCEISTGMDAGYFGVSPFEGSYVDDSKIQILYKKEELAPLLLDNCAISGIGFEVTSDENVLLFHDMKVSLNNVNINQFSNYGNSFSAAGTEVFSANYDPILGWSYINFDIPFIWDKEKNLLITICYNNPNDSWYFNGSCEVVSHTTTTNLALLDIGNNTDGCSLNLPSTYNSRPDIRFLTGNPVGEAVSYEWSQPWTLNDASIPNPIATPTGTTFYTVTASYQNCVAEDSYSIFVYDCTENDTSIVMDVFDAGQEGLLLFTTAQLFDLQGRLVIPSIEIINNQAILTNLNLPSSIYILKLRSDDGRMQSRKIYLE